MQADKIHISHFQFITLEKLEIERPVGRHATARLRGSIRDQDEDCYRRLLLQKVWVKISAEDNKGEKCVLMTGIVAGFSLERLRHVRVLELILKSGTYLMDGREHFRSFQDASITHRDVMEMITKYYGKSEIMAEEKVDAQVDFLLQYKETDWEFIRRIASRFGLPVTPAVTSEGVFYYVGKTQYALYEIKEPINFHIGKYIGAFMQQSANGEGSFREQDYMEYRISTREIYGLWDFLRVGNQGGHVCRIYSEYKQGELIHSYWLRPAEALRTGMIFNERQQGCSFQAEVEAVMGDKVKVVLVGDENCSQKISRWFPYSTGYSSPDGAGWYCMPEPGDRVRLQMPDCMEENSYIISSVHMDTKNGRKLPDHKSFRTKYGKELLFTPESLELTNNQGMAVRIVDGEGIQITSDKDISIIAGGNMTISSQNDALIVAGTESVDIRQGGAGLHIDENIVFSGGKFRIQ